MRDPWARHRELLQAGIARCLDDADSRLTNHQLVREQMEAADPAEYESASLICLAAAEAVGSPPEAAVSGAVSLAFLSQMAVVFTRLENAGGAPSLSTAWGMPRALNAGDAYFALAQECLLSGMEEIPFEDRFAATGLLDRGGRALLNYLQEKAIDGSSIASSQRALFPAALSIGALLGGADAGRRQGMAGLGDKWAEMPEDELTRALASDPAGWLAT